MKMLIAGVYNLAGISKATQKPFSLHRASVLEPIEQGGMMVHSYGFKAVEYDIIPEALNFCIGKTFPMNCDAEVGLKNGKPIIISLGILQPPKSAAA